MCFLFKEKFLEKQKWASDINHLKHAKVTQFTFPLEYIYDVIHRSGPLERTIFVSFIWPSKCSHSWPYWYCFEMVLAIFFEHICRKLTIQITLWRVRECCLVFRPHLTVPWAYSWLCSGIICTGENIVSRSNESCLHTWQLP